MAMKSPVQGKKRGTGVVRASRGVPCGQSWIPRTSKCSKAKAATTPAEAKQRGVAKAKALHKLKGEVKAAKGMKARSIPGTAGTNRSTISTGFHIRDTLVSPDKFNRLPVKQRKEILKLKSEFDKSGYIDARTAIGPSQSARQTAKQRKEITGTASKVFEIENKVKALLLSPKENRSLASKQNKAAIQKRIAALNNSMKTAEQFDSKRISSKRDNASKQAYLKQKEEKQKLEAALAAMAS